MEDILSDSIIFLSSFPSPIKWVWPTNSVRFLGRILDASGSFVGTSNSDCSYIVSPLIKLYIIDNFDSSLVVKNIKFLIIY